MKNITMAVFIVLIIFVLGLYFVSFQVRETENALVTTFGKPSKEITTPGFKFKWPSPIQQVYKFDSRLNVLEGDQTETTTKGAVPIIVNTYVVWRIARPLEFFTAVGTVKEAENKLRSQLSNTQNKIIGKHEFSEFVNNDPCKIQFEQIQREMLADLSQAVSNNYGIEIKTLGLKQLKISGEVSKDVFERMKGERNRKTAETIAQGNAEATKIKTNADAQKTELLAAAEARAKAIQGQGDAEAAKYYKMLDEDPGVAIFLRNVEALKKTLEKRSTIVISAETEPFKLLREMPNIESKKGLTSDRSR